MWNGISFLFMPNTRQPVCYAVRGPSYMDPLRGSNEVFSSTLLFTCVLSYYMSAVCDALYHGDDLALLAFARHGVRPLAMH